MNKILEVNLFWFQIITFTSHMYEVLLVHYSHQSCRVQLVTLTPTASQLPLKKKAWF